MINRHHVSTLNNATPKGRRRVAKTLTGWPKGYTPQFVALARERGAKNPEDIAKLAKSGKGHLV